MAKVKMTGRIISQEKIAAEIYSMWIEAAEIAEQTRPGQFISVYCKDNSRILPRPISVCEIDKEKGALRIVYRIAGKGTDEFSHMQAGDTVDIMGPLGNGFPMEEAKGKRIFLMGGGIGIPPMVQTAKEAEAEITVIAGYRNSEIFLKEELEKAGKLVVATEDGSVGTKGNVMDAIRENNLEADVIFACGPTPMLRAIKKYAEEKNILCYLSMEEKWHAALAHVWPVCASLRKRTAILMCIISGYVRTALYF